MPSAVSRPAPLPPWKRPAKTKARLDWADIAVIDISSFDEPGCKERLAEQLQEAVSLVDVQRPTIADASLQVQSTGFFSVTGTGFTEEEVERQFSLGQAFLSRPAEEKNKPELRCDFGKGNYFGYQAVCLLTR